MSETLDSLSIVLRASAGDAVTAIDSIVTALTRLNGALNNFKADSPYMKGLNNLASGLKAVRISLNGLDANNIKEVAKALDKMADSGSKIAQLTNLMPTMDKAASKMTEIVAASDNTYKEAERIGNKLHFDSAADGVARLAEGMERLQASIGDDNATREAMEHIDALLEKYARAKNELQEFNKAQLEVVRTANIKLGHGTTEALGGDYETARRNRGVMGIANTSKNGTNVSSIVDENTILGIEKEANEIDQLNAVMERTKEAAEGAKREFVSFHEADVTLTGGLEALRAETDDIARSMGIAAEQIREAHSAIDDDDFMNQDTTGAVLFDDPAETISQLRDSAQEAAPAIEALNTAEQKLVENSEPLAQVGNIFQGITTALESLQHITLSDSLANLTYLKDAVGRFGGEPASRAAANIQSLGQALGNFHFDMPSNWSDLVALSQVFSRFGQKSQSKANYNLLAIRNALERFQGLSINPTITASVQQLGDGLYRFGLAKMDKAVQNIPQLAGSMSQLITSLANAPQVSESTIRLVSALGNMSISGSALNSSLNNVSGGLKRYTGHAINARKASMSLAQAFGKMYANFFIFFRLARRFKQDIDLASQLTEVQNVVDVTFTDMADKMNEFSKSAVEALGMSELTAKQIGSKYQAMGSAMGITPQMAQSTNDFVQTATNGYADVANSMADVSINLTRLAGDMASFYNQDYADVAEKLQAVFTGQTRPLRAFGLDLTEASLKEFALRNGMEANIKTMTQAEKTLLRYQYVLAHTTAAHGDFQRTADTWANSVRVATEKLNQLRIVLGKIAIYTFKPLVQNFNKAMDQIIKGAEGLLNALGKIFGWKVEWSDAGVLKDEADDADELADGMGDAADNAKKFKNFLLGIDELNLLPDNSDKDKGGGGGVGDLIGDMNELGGFKITPIEKGFESLYDTLFKLGKRINEIVKQLLQGIDWEAVYRKAENFGRGLAKFVNGLLSDSETFYEIGKLLAGGINTLAHVIKAYHKEFDGWQWGVDLGNIVNGFIDNLDWREIQSAAVELAHDLAQTINGAFVTIKWGKVGSTIAEGLNTAIDYFYTLGKEIKWGVIGTSIAEGINGFFKTFDFAQAAETLNLWAKGLLDALINALDRTDWKKVGQSIGEFISRIDVLEIAGKLVHALGEALEGAFSAFGGLLSTAPIETALITAIALPFSSRTFSRNFGGVIRSFSKKLGNSLYDDLLYVFGKGTKGKELGTSLFGTFANAFKNTEVGLDSLGNFVNGGTLTGLTNGFNAVSASLSVATKALGGLTVGFAEFFAVKDAIYNIVMGTDNLAASIAELAGASAIAGVALSALLGVPMGLIITGAVAGTAAIFGISKALEEISENNVISSMTRDLGEAGTTLDQLALSYKSSADTITGDLEKMNREADKLSTMKSDLSEMLGGLQLVSDAAGLGAGLTNDAVEELIGNIGEIKTAWEDYIKAQYDYLIQSTINNYRFLKSQGDVTEEETEYYKNRINELTKAKTNDLQVTTDAVQKAEEAWKAYNEAYTNNVSYDDRGFKVVTQDVIELREEAERLTGNLLEIETTVGGISSSALPELDSKLNESKRTTENFILSFSNIDASSIDDLSTAIGGYESQIQETYNNSKQIIDEYKQALKDNGLSEEDAVRQTKAYYDALYAQTEESLTLVQEGLYEKYYSVLAKEDRHAAALYAEKVVAPFIDEFPNVVSQEGKKIEPTIQDAVGSIYEQAFEWRGTELFPKLVSNWRELYYEAGTSVSPHLKALGEKMIGNIADGVEKGSGEFKKSIEDTTKGTEQTAKTSAYAYGSTKRAMEDVVSTSVLLKNGMVDVNKVLENTSQSSTGIKDVATNLEGVKRSFGTFGAALAPVKTGFTEFAETTKLNMINTTTVFGQSFNSIMKYGNQTIAWLKSSFVPYFSSGYWNSITASIPNAFGNAFRQAINIMQNLWGQFAKWANDNMKMNVKAGGKKEADIKVEIPQYSTGGFPEDGFFYTNHSEMVGKFSNGKTAVANNEQIVEGIRQGVYEAVSSAMQNGGSQGVTVELVGDASDIFTAVVKENNRTIMRTGASPIRN